ncbi:vacuolar protein sorting-associated protein 35-domain-containing protein [Phakopsora pachyrhizi]|uniref:Vacuolar protein sorting-associated protein 35-domain-containing protein n=1 Tax=Phakopsora pachyrhizi TaxID=170000 RepID=A0AAV0BEW7_PHAPC|nr:vacuolar protein sorting-associated protein 35-domain-containing protein [Phakopsora pachyrhizi]
MTRDCLPIGSEATDPGGFLTNFIEMKKLCRREMERKELKILVGTNFVRLSEPEGVVLDMYQLSTYDFLEQFVSCKDIIAQVYLMEVFAKNESPEETKRKEEDAARRLAAKIKAQKEKRRQNMQREEAKVKDSLKDVPPVASTENKTSISTNGDYSTTSIISEAGPSITNQPVKKFHGIPANVPVFEVFWLQVVELIRASSEFCFSC